MRSTKRSTKNRHSYKLSMFLFMLVLGFTYLSTSNVFAATFNVPGDFATIQEAIDDAGTVNGDTINIGAGTHIEAAVHITKELIIQGQGIGVTILDPSSLALGFSVVLYPEANNITIQDMTIQNADQAIRFEMNGGTIDSTDILRVSMINNSSRAIEVNNATTVTTLFIDDCNFDNTVHGIRVSSSGHLDGVRIDDSSFSNNAIGIYVANDGNTSTMADMAVRRNTFSNHTTAAIFLEEAQNTRIQDNTFTNNRRDIQLFKWYQPSVVMSDVIIRRNTMIGTTDAVFAIFNADNGGQTEFNNIRFIRNTALTSDASAVFAGAHRTGPPSTGGTGWDSVRVRNNCFTGITTAGNGVRYFLPTGITPDQALAGAILDVTRNWWGTTDIPTITALMEVPAITDFEPIRTTDICDPNFFVLQPLSPSNPGVINTMSITGGIPNGDVMFGYGFNEGILDTDAICEDSELDIADFNELATITGDASGSSSFSVFVPSNFLDMSVLIQSLDMTTCVESGLNLETVVQIGSNITHLPVNPGIAGGPNILSASGVFPNGNVAFLYGFVEQAVTADNICPGLQAGILNPRLITVFLADEAGNSAISVRVPANFADVTVKLQAVDMTSCTGSNVLSETF
ncbi:MAG: right-handed parallel beta-helix repeat-containing protein [Thermodesulfobacteriota bacterium]